MITVEMKDGSIYQFLCAKSEKYVRRALKDCSGGVKRVIPATEVRDAIKTIQPDYSPQPLPENRPARYRHIGKTT
jgi:hypothetical protein